MKNTPKTLHSGNRLPDSTSVQSLIAKSQALEASGDIATSIQAACLALSQAHARQDPAGAADALVRQAYLEFRLGHYPRARSLAEQALDLAAPDALAGADAWLILGNVAAETDSLDEAEARYQRAADLSRSLGYLFVRMRSQHNLAMGVYFPRGAFGLALVAAQEAYRLANQGAYRDYLPYPLTTMAWIYQVTGRIALARKTLAELEQALAPGSLHEGYFNFLTGEQAIDEGDPDDAPVHYTRARSIAEAIGEPGLNVQARLGMSRYFRLGGDYACAHSWAADALGVAERAGYVHMRGLSLIELGRAAWLEGDPCSAEESFIHAAACLASLRATYDQTRATLLLAALQAAQKISTAPATWEELGRLVLSNGFGFLLIRESQLVYSLTASYMTSTKPQLRSLCAQMLEQLSRQPPLPLTVITLGRFQVTQGARNILPRELNQRRAGELFVLLLFSPGRRLSTDQVFEVLWPDKDPASAQSLFHHATSSLRQVLEPGLPARVASRYLTVEDGQIFLTLPEGSWVDYEAFESHFRKKEWESALAVYGGEFLSLCLYQDWTTLYRQRINYCIQTILISMAEQRLENQRFQEALELCLRLLAIEPWHERAVWIGMRACQAMADPASALRLYRDLEKNLAAELGVAPHLDVQALARELVA
jgi:DNA-binding SARP family transcriptional activator